MVILSTEKLTWVLAKDIVPGEFLRFFFEDDDVFSSAATKLNLGHHYSSMCPPTQTESLGLKIGSTVRILKLRMKF